MLVYINSESREIPSENKLNDLLPLLHLTEAKGIAIAVNEKVIIKSEWPDYQLSSNDRITIIRATQGG